MEHQADVHPQLRLILPDAGPGCEKNGRRATWPVTTRSGRHQVPVAVLPTAKSLSAFSLKPQSDRLLDVCFRRAPTPPPFSSINSTPAFSSALRIADALARVIAVFPSTDSAR